MAEIVQIDECTWRIEDDFVRFFLLEGSDLAVLIDSGANCLNAKDIAESLTTLPIMLINTHGDGDHTSGTAAFEEIHMNLADYVNQKLAEKFPNTVLCPTTDGDEIELGGRKLRIIDIPGHTKGSIAILDTGRRMIFTGDSIQKGHIFMFGNHRAPEQFADALKTIISYADEYDEIVASHDEPILPADYAGKVLEAWERVVRGDVSYESVDMFGTSVKSYTTEVCGFFC